MEAQVMNGIPWKTLEHESIVLQQVCAILLAVTWITLFLRIISRAFVSHVFQAEDWILVVSQIFYTTTCIFTIVCASGMQRMGASAGHFFYTELGTYTRPAIATYALSLIFSRVSLSIFFLRIYSADRPKRIIIWILTSVCVLIGALTVILNAAICQSYDITKVCHVPFNDLGFTVSYSIANATCDVGYAAVAIIAISSAKLARHDKILACILLCFGLVSGIASIARAVTVVQLTDDVPMLAGISTARWSVVEAGVCIMATALMTVRPLLRCCFQRASKASRSLSSRSRAANTEDGTGEFQPRSDSKATSEKRRSSKKPALEEFEIDEILRKHDSTLGDVQHPSEQVELRSV